MEKINKKIERTYNEKGKIIEKTVYRTDGKTIHYILKYDDCNKLTTRILYSIDEKAVTKYNDNERPIKTTYYNLDKTINRVEYYGDDMIKIIYYNTDETINHIERWTYSAIRNKFCNADGTTKKQYKNPDNDDVDNNIDE